MKKLMCCAVLFFIFTPACAVDEPVVVFVNQGQTLNSAIADFSQELFRQTINSPVIDDENMVISPLSAYYALAMVSLGANGQTFDEFARLLGEDPKLLAIELSKYAESLMDVSGSTKLSVAGSVWICDEFTVAPEFSRQMTDYFGAPAFPRDFGARETVDEINAWIYEKTNGLIGEVINGIDKYDVMYLINTLYMYAKWANAFRPMNESIRTFTPESGTAKDVDFLTAGGSSGTMLDVRVTQKYESVLLPYNDDRLGFFMVRPTDDTTVRDFAQTNDLAEIFAGLEQQKNVVVHMPELDKNFDFGLIEILQAMGLVDAFCFNTADFEGLVESLLGYPGLYISEAEQFVRIMVDSEGTEAAAVTIIGARRTSLPPPPQLILDFNTPYIYAIYDLHTGIPLFIGIVDNPAAF